MTALLALLLQAAAPPPAVPSPAPPAAKPAPALKPLDAAAAVELFKSLCWTSFRDPAALAAAVVASSVPLAEQPRAGGPTQAWRADTALLTYSAGDDLPPTVPSRQCILRTRLAGAADQLVLAARVAQALALKGGATRTGPTGAQTTWDVAQPDGRTVRLIVATANASGGQTDLRQVALLLAAK